VNSLGIEGDQHIAAVELLRSTSAEHSCSFKGKGHFPYFHQSDSAKSKLQPKVDSSVRAASDLAERKLTGLILSVE